MEKNIITFQKNTSSATLLCGNCSEIMKSFDDGCIDMVLTSPPYDKLRKYNGFTFDFETIVQQLYRVIKLGGVIVWVVSDATINGSETGTSFKQALYFKEIGFNLHDTMIYQQLCGVPMNHNRYEKSFEYMFVFSKGRPLTFNPILEYCTNAGKKSTGGLSKSQSKKESNSNRGGWGYGNLVKDTKIKGNVWGYTTGHGHSTLDKIAFQHPAIFPEQLAIDHILSWSNVGDTILDPFCGSGTTCKMAIQTKRNTIGIDISSEYIEISRKRLQEVQVNLF